MFVSLITFKCAWSRECIRLQVARLDLPIPLGMSNRPSVWNSAVDELPRRALGCPEVPKLQGPAVPASSKEAFAGQSSTAGSRIASEKSTTATTSAQRLAEGTERPPPPEPPRWERHAGNPIPKVGESSSMGYKEAVRRLAAAQSALLKSQRERALGRPPRDRTHRRNEQKQGKGKRNSEGTCDAEATAAEEQGQ